MSATRTALEQSWEAARRQGNGAVSVTLNAASFAGMMLDIEGGDARRASAKVPAAGGVFWSRVLVLLASVEREDRAARGPVLRLINVGEGS